MQATPSVGSLGGLSPVAVVWCRQVDNEAESPGYTTIPEDFAGRRETLEAIRVIGNLTVNVADTHDYWDPDPSQPLSYYPNLFLYPAANGRYTCVGRMFLSTEDRPRLGMKTLVFATADLVATGEFGAAILRAHASMGGKSAPARVTAEPDASVFQAVGEGFLFHRGSTDPVVIIASEQWEASGQVILNLVRLLPTSLVALGAFLDFPYFLPEAKVNLHEFTEQVPLALAIMRVPRGEAQGDRYEKRLESWRSAPVSLRDLTRVTPSRSKDTLPLILQYVRDHQDARVTEVTRRVDAVEGTRTRAQIQDADRQGGKDRRKEMWRIGTAMETAALLLVKPKGRSVGMSGEAVKRANEYLQAQPSTPLGHAAEDRLAPPEAYLPPPPAAPASGQHPPWLQRGVDIKLPSSASPASVPLSTADDNSLRLPPPPPPGASAAPTVVAAPSPITDGELDMYIRRLVDQRLSEQPAAAPANGATLDARLKDVSDQNVRALQGLQADVNSRLAAVEARPVYDPGAADAERDRRLKSQVDPLLAELTEKSHQDLQANTEAWAERLRDELRRSLDEVKEGVVHGEDELRAALAAQFEVEISEAKDQGTQLRESIEARVRELLAQRADEIDQRRAKDVRDLEQRLAILVDGRTKDVETRLKTGVAEQQAARTEEVEQRRAKEAREQELRLTALVDARLKESEGRLKTVLTEQQSLRADENDQRRAKDVRDLEQRVGILLDGRTKDVESRVRTAMVEQQSRSSAALDERIGGVEKRLAVEREARVAELTEAQAQAMAGLQVHLQAYMEQKLHENQDREREKYVELLARLRTDIEQNFARSIDPVRTDAAIRERIANAAEAMRKEQQMALAQSVSEAETRMRAAQDDNVLRLETVESQIQQREADLARIERSLRSDVDDLDRRIQVLTDRMIPLLRRTWLKVGDLEKGGAVPIESETHLKEMRREMIREMRRIEAEMLEQTGELRDRLEGTIAHQGRIWLNLLKQLSAETDDMASDLITGPRPANRTPRLSSSRSDDEFLTSDLGTPVAYAPIDDDPPNPIAPSSPPPEDAPRDTRRRTRRS
jgi:hypothetical protein